MKTFSKDSLKVGDEFETYEDIFPKTYVVTEVLQNTFGAVIKGRTLTFWFSFEHAKVKGWTILPNEEEKVKKIIIGDVNKGIIKNNEELIRQINSKQAEDTSEPYRIGLCDAMAIIQSKNDSLSKDL